MDADPLPLRAMQAIVDECQVRVVDDFTRKVTYQCNFCKKEVRYWEELQHENSCLVLECLAFLNL